jgi:hypothetical protein
MILSANALMKAVPASYEFVPQERAVAILRHPELAIDQLNDWLTSKVGYGHAYPSYRKVDFAHDSPEELDETGQWRVVLGSRNSRAPLYLPLHDWLVYHQGELHVMSWQRFALFRGAQDNTEFVEPLTAASSVSNEELADVLAEERATAAREALVAFGLSINGKQGNEHDTATLMWVFKRLEEFTKGVGSANRDRGADT